MQAERRFDLEGIVSYKSEVFIKRNIGSFMQWNAVINSLKCMFLVRLRINKWVNRIAKLINIRKKIRKTLYTSTPPIYTEELLGWV